MRRLRSLLIHTSLVLLSLLVALLLVELTLWAIDYREARPHPVYNVDRRDPTRLLPHSTDRYHSGEFDFTLRANRFGRRDREWSAEAMADPENILAIGDSFIMGYGVEQGASIPGRMEALAAKRGEPLEVFNFGIAGETALPEYRHLFEQAVALGIASRRVVVALFLGNDFNPRRPRQPPAGAPGERAETTSGRWMRRLRNTRSYRLVRHLIATSPPLVDLTLRLGEALDLPTFDGRSAPVFLRRYSAQQQAFIERQLRLMERLDALARHRGRQLTFVVIPNKIQVENARALDNAHYQPDRPNRLIRAHCARHRLRCLDLTPALREIWRRDGKPLYYPVDRHFTPRGNDLAARHILDALSARAVGLPGGDPP
ncbi:alginate O-acetyltransferase AlgX-related protein [Endothiovibrio diazotrophicus]